MKIKKLNLFTFFAFSILAVFTFFAFLILTGLTSYNYFSEKIMNDVSNIESSKVLKISQVEKSEIKDFNRTTINKQTPEKGSANNSFIDNFKQCTELNTEEITGLNDIKSNFGLNTMNHKHILRKNLVYNIDGDEHRVSLFPSEKQNTWSVDEFTVDSENLPIPGHKTKINKFIEAMNYVNKKYETKDLKIDEVDIKILDDNFNGTALLVNGDIKQLTLHNRSLNKILECNSDSCTCAQL